MQITEHHRFCITARPYGRSAVMLADSRMVNRQIWWKKKQWTCSYHDQQKRTRRSIQLLRDDHEFCLWHQATKQLRVSWDAWDAWEVWNAMAKGKRQKAKAEGDEAGD
jgi:hypothetical protein